ncbi:MAG TPA: HAMP domain-containing protein [Oligoflexia bacterium]|nr:HAMP domain-containing protein [Oligoflexia bacterium]
MPYKRSKFLINRRFQLKFAFFVCSWIFALSMVYPIIIYNVFEYFLKILSAPHDVLTVDKVKYVENQVVIVLGILQLLFLTITFMLSIFLSHRIAGPLFKLRRAIDEVSRGNFDQRITFRKNDHFMELQDGFNEMVQHLGVRRWKE